MLSPRTSTALEGLSHGFFGRRGGVSSGLYSSLNCGLGSGDGRAEVLENRARVAAHLGTTGDRLLTCHQIHSAEAVIVEAPFADGTQPKADALVTRTPGLALGALAADCAPVLLADRQAAVIAAAHAGWKGALGGILESTVASMEQVGARRPDIAAVVGPSISQRAYQVGPEFQDAFVAADRRYARFFSHPPGSPRPYFDLAGFIVHRLQRAGVGRVEQVAACTYAEAETYFSYRRTTHRAERDYGRQISAIFLAA